MQLGIIYRGSGDDAGDGDTLRDTGLKMNNGGRVLSRTDDVPGGPTKGDCYIVPASATGAWSGQDDDVAYYDGAAWEFWTPSEGWEAWVIDEQLKVVFTSGAWDDEAIGSSGLPDAPSDGTLYGRQDGAWVAVPSGGGGGAGGPQSLGSFDLNATPVDAIQINGANQYSKIMFVGVGAHINDTLTASLSSDGGVSKETIIGMQSIVNEVGSSDTNAVATSTAFSGEDLFVISARDDAFFIWEIEGLDLNTGFVTIKRRNMATDYTQVWSGVFAASDINTILWETASNMDDGVIHVWGYASGNAATVAKGFSANLVGGAHPFSDGTPTNVVFHNEVFDDFDAYDHTTGEFTVPAALDGQIMIFNSHLLESDFDAYEHYINEVTTGLILGNRSNDTNQQTVTFIRRVTAGERYRVRFENTGGSGDLWASEANHFTGMVLSVGGGNITVNNILNSIENAEDVNIDISALIEADLRRPLAVVSDGVGGYELGLMDAVVMQIPLKYVGTPAGADEQLAAWIPAIDCTILEGVSGFFRVPATDAPASEIVIEIDHDSVTIGTITISATTGFCLVDIAADVDLDAGDLIELTSQGASDITGLFGTLAVVARSA